MMTPEERAKEWATPLAWRVGYRTADGLTRTVEEVVIHREGLEALLVAAYLQAISEERERCINRVHDWSGKGFLKDSRSEIPFTLEHGRHVEAAIRSLV